MAALAQARWLLIGNSRWHWATQGDQGLRVWHHQPCPRDLADTDPTTPEGFSLLPLVAWAAVGAVPELAALDPAKRLDLSQVPLQAMPPWLGIDRALVGWRAWQITQGPVLVADAGTALSMTRVDGQGRFAGGRLQAGAGLQLQALAQGTVQLPCLAPLLPGEGNLDGAPFGEAWPLATEVAMQSGITWGLAAAIATGFQQIWQIEPTCRLFLTGGDGERLAPLVTNLLGPDLGRQLTLAPDLALEALAMLAPVRPGPDH